MNNMAITSTDFQAVEAQLQKASGLNISISLFWIDEV